MNEQQTRSSLTGDVFTVSVSGDIAPFVTWKERLCSTINNTVAPYALFSDCQQRFVSFKIEMLPDRPMPVWLLAGSAAKKQAAWLSIIGPPLLRIYWLTISDTDAVKWETVRSRLESWLDVTVISESTATKVDLPALVILHVEAQAHVGAITSLSRVQQQLSDKIRSLNTNRSASSSSQPGNVHCFSFQPFTKNEADPTACERLAASLHSLLGIQAIERVRRIEDFARVERERCCRAAMAAVPLKGSTDERLFFANMFLLEEAVARGYAALSLFSDALARLDLIDAVLSQSAANCFCMAGRPLAVWISECLAHAPSHVDCVKLVLPPESDWPLSPCPLMMLENGKHPLIETRAELLARQAAVIFRMAAAGEGIPGKLTPSAAANKLTSYALQVAHSVVVESSQLSISGKSHPSPKSITDAFIFLLFCETAAACQVLTSSSLGFSPIAQNPMSLSLLGHHALKSLLRLGRNAGFLVGPPSTINESENLHFTVSMLQLLRYRSSASAPAPRPSDNNGNNDGYAPAPTRPETHSDRLARLLTSSQPENFVAALVDFAESMLATFKSSGLRRWVRHLAFQLAGIYLQANKHGCSLSFSCVAAAEPLLLDCIGTWLASRQHEMALAALHLLVDDCYSASFIASSEQQQLKRRRAWALLHINAYSAQQKQDKNNNNSLTMAEVGSLCQQLEKASSTLLSGSYLFTCPGVNLSASSKNGFSATVNLKVQSFFPHVVENCHVEVVFRVASVMRPTSYGRHSFDSISDDDTLMATSTNNLASMPPFRPEVSASNGTGRSTDDVFLLKTAAPVTLRPNCENDVEFKMKIPMTPDYESGALLYFVRAVVSLYDGAMNLLCGNSMKSSKPLIFRPPEENKEPHQQLLEEKLCEISLSDCSSSDHHKMVATNNGNGHLNGKGSLDNYDGASNISLGSSLSRSSVFGAEFSLEPVFVAGAPAIVFIVVDIMQVMLSDAPSQLIDPVVAIEKDGDETVMLDRPIFDYSTSPTSSIVIPLVPPSDQCILPMILARLVWRVPPLTTSTKQLRVIMSCTLRHHSDVSAHAYCDDDDQLTMSSPQFDLAAIFNAKSVSKLVMPPGASNFNSVRATETRM